VMTQNDTPADLVTVEDVRPIRIRLDNEKLRESVMMDDDMWMRREFAYLGCTDFKVVYTPLSYDPASAEATHFEFEFEEDRAVLFDMMPNGLFHQLLNHLLYRNEHLIDTSDPFLSNPLLRNKEQ